MSVNERVRARLPAPAASDQPAGRPGRSIHHVVYADVVKRIQLYFDDQEVEWLRKAERRTGASRSELVRRAVRHTYGEATVEEKLAIIKETAGMWKDRAFTAEEYVDALRGGGIEARLEKLGF